MEQAAVTSNEKRDDNVIAFHAPEAPLSADERRQVRAMLAEFAQVKAACPMAQRILGDG